MDFQFHSDSELDEVDAFNANREKVMLDDAGVYGRHQEEDDFSDQEVMALKHRNVEEGDDDDEEEGDDDDEEEEDIEEEDEEGWGTRQNYYGGDDVSDDESGKQMAEEALKQQQKHLQDLEMDDFVDEDMMDEWKQTAEQYDAAQKGPVQLVVNENIQESLENLDEEDQLKLLTSSFPEFVPLVKEFTSLSPKLSEFKLEVSSPVMDTKIAALSVYLSTIASYFSLFVENLQSDDKFLTMKHNPVMEAILGAREVWRQANELNFADEVDVDEDEIEFEDEAELEDEEIESEDELEQEEELQEEVEDEADTSASPDISTKRTIKKLQDKNLNDFSEAGLDTVDMEEKQRRKKSLRFYTSKIDQAANKGSNLEKYGGDMDLPYRERLYERQQRLMEEARKRGLGQGELLGDDLDGQDVNSDDEKAAKDINEDEQDAYYQNLKQSKAQQKSARKEAHELAVKAAKQGKLAELQNTIGEDGKRALNFQILKNKGLTPHRRNIDRNARVKKRKKYDKAQKKLKSVRQVYTGAQGPYEGEKTGIKKGVSRSVKFT